MPMAVCPFTPKPGANRARVEPIGVHDQLYKKLPVERTAELPQRTDIFLALQPEVQTDLRLRKFSDFKHRVFYFPAPRHYQCNQPDDLAAHEEGH
jgi:hypothetical protein